MRLHGASLTGVLLASLASAAALAEPQPAAPPAAAPPAAAPPAAASPAAASAPAATPAPATPGAAQPALATPPAAAAQGGGAKPKAKGAEPPLPPPEVRLWVTAPSPNGPWAFRIDNEGAHPLRIPADVRLLRFEIDPGEVFVADTGDPKKPKKPKKPGKPVVCSIPAPLRPDSFPDKSALLLAPGEAYIESFDPRLFCFGKAASEALTGGAVVRARFGWDAPKQATKKPPAPPYAVESTAFPPIVAPLREVSAPTMVLSYEKQKPAPDPRRPNVALVAGDAGAEDAQKRAEAPKGESPAGAAPGAAPGAAQPGSASPAAAAGAASTAGAPSKPAAPSAASAPGATPADPKAPASAGAPPDGKSTADEKDPSIEAMARPSIVDENAPRLELSATPFVDASAPGRISITVTATNAGHRPMLAAIRPRMVGFKIEGPTGATRCEAAPATHAIPRDLFSTLQPGKAVSMTVLLSEVCPRAAFARPGLYRIKATLHAEESGAELGLNAYTAVVSVKTPTYLRLLSAPEPFYTTGPKAVPIPRPKPKPDADADSAE